MADDELEDGKGEQVRFTAARQVWKNLGWLARNTVLRKNSLEYTASWARQSAIPTRRCTGRGFAQSRPLSGKSDIAGDVDLRPTLTRSGLNECKTKPRHLDERAF